MWIDGAWTRRGAWLVLVFVGVAACGEADAPAPGSEFADEAATEVPPQDVPETIGDLFPEGDGRDLVLANCSACHAVACSAMGQRTAARWATLRESHGDHVAALSEDDLDTIFAYLQENFDDSQPEPFVPPHFVEAGCTPF